MEIDEAKTNNAGEKNILKETLEDLDEVSQSNSFLIFLTLENILRAKGVKKVKPPKILV